jgi:hypothetical protein
MQAIAGIEAARTVRPISNPLGLVQSAAVDVITKPAGRPLRLDEDAVKLACRVAHPAALPSECLPVVWGGELPDENAFENEAEAHALIGIMMRHWNAIIAEYETEKV